MNERNDRIRRILDTIKEAAERAKSKDGPWRVTHDADARPGSKEPIVFGIYKYADVRTGDVAKHIAVCNPSTILKLVEDVEELLKDKNND